MSGAKSGIKDGEKTATCYHFTINMIKDTHGVLEGVNEVNRLATRGEKILLTTDKTRKKIPTSDKKIN